MERILFVSSEEQNIFIVPKSEVKDFIVPSIGHRVTWQKTYMIVQAVEHNYDEKSIIVTVKVM